MEIGTALRSLRWPSNPWRSESGPVVLVNCCSLTYPSFPSILFKLLAFTEDEKARYFASTASIDECISSAESWASNREELSRALEGFDTRQELVVCTSCHA